MNNTTSPPTIFTPYDILEIMKMDMDMAVKMIMNLRPWKGSPYRSLYLENPSSLSHSVHSAVLEIGHLFDVFFTPV